MLMRPCLVYWMHLGSGLKWDPVPEAIQKRWTAENPSQADLVYWRTGASENTQGLSATISQLFGRASKDPKLEYGLSVLVVWDLSDIPDGKALNTHLEQTSHLMKVLGEAKAVSASRYRSLENVVIGLLVRLPREATPGSLSSGSSEDLRRNQQSWFKRLAFEMGPRRNLDAFIDNIWLLGPSNFEDSHRLGISVENPGEYDDLLSETVVLLLSTDIEAQLESGYAEDGIGISSIGAGRVVFQGEALKRSCAAAKASKLLGLVCSKDFRTGPPADSTFLESSVILSQRLHGFSGRGLVEELCPGGQLEIMTDATTGSAALEIDPEELEDTEASETIIKRVMIQAEMYLSDWLFSRMQSARKTTRGIAGLLCSRLWEKLSEALDGSLLRTFAEVSDQLEAWRTSVSRQKSDARKAVGEVLFSGSLGCQDAAASAPNQMDAAASRLRSELRRRPLVEAIAARGLIAAATFGLGSGLFIHNLPPEVVDVPIPSPHIVIGVLVALFSALFAILKILKARKMRRRAFNELIGAIEARGRMLFGQFLVSEVALACDSCNSFLGERIQNVEGSSEQSSGRIPVELYPIPPADFSERMRHSLQERLERAVRFLERVKSGLLEMTGIERLRENRWLMDAAREFGPDDMPFIAGNPASISAEAEPPERTLFLEFSKELAPLKRGYFKQAEDLPKEEVALAEELVGWVGKEGYNYITDKPASVLLEYFARKSTGFGDKIRRFLQASAHPYFTLSRGVVRFAAVEPPAEAGCDFLPQEFKDNDECGKRLATIGLQGIAAVSIMGPDPAGRLPYLGLPFPEGPGSDDEDDGGEATSV